jgi:hypothetical protein
LYKGYTIEKQDYGYGFYLTESGVDCYYDGDGWRSNVQYASSIDDAKEQIDDIIEEEKVKNLQRKA